MKLTFEEFECKDVQVWTLVLFTKGGAVEKNLVTTGLLQIIFFYDLGQI